MSVERPLNGMNAVCGHLLSWLSAIYMDSTSSGRKMPKPEGTEFQVQ